jgi:hypothetical protein
MKLNLVGFKPSFFSFQSNACKNVDFIIGNLFVKKIAFAKSSLKVQSSLLFVSPSNKITFTV